MIETIIILLIFNVILIILCFFLLRDKKALIAQNRRLINLQVYIDFLKNEETAKDAALKALEDHIVELLQKNRKMQWTAGDDQESAYSRALADVQHKIDLL